MDRGLVMGNLDSGELIRDLALNLVSIFLLVYVIYFRRHRRWDQVVGYVAFNISLFTVSAEVNDVDEQENRDEVQRQIPDQFARIEISHRQPPVSSVYRSAK
jgi:Ca2+/Na+ antiporter